MRPPPDGEPPEPPLGAPPLPPAAADGPRDDTARVPARTVQRPAVFTGALLAVMAAGAVATWADDDLLRRGGLYAAAWGDGEGYRFVTSIFLHANVAHLALNGMSLWLFGGLAERAYGWWRYLVLFFASGLLGNVAFAALGPENTLAVGASGAVFGIMGALALVHRGDGRNSLVVLLGANIVLQFVLPNIAWQAHMGGLAAGLALGLLFRTPGGRRAMAR